MKYFLIQLVFILFALPAGAATLYLEPAEGEYGPGDSFKAAIKIQVGECINTVSTGLKFPADVLQVVDFLSGESILNLWLESPQKADLPEINREGIIRFTGGIPGGYCGPIPGDPGDSNKIGEVIFALPGMIFGDLPEYLELELLPDSQVLLNDGLGTADSLQLRNSRLKTSNISKGLVMEGRDIIKNDRIPPEPFIVELYDDTNLYQGRYYIIFSTVDKQSGIDHYEVMEERIPEPEQQKTFLGRVFKAKEPASIWQPAQIPYLLADQSLNSKIKVKAIDRNGNERLVEFIPPEDIRVQVKQKVDRNFWLLAVSAGLVLVLLVILILLIKSHFRKKKISSYAQKNTNENNQDFKG